MKGITKRFPGVLALDHVDFCAQRGEIHALMGQNGAGKSTLMKILAGDYPPSSGQILIDGLPVSFHSPHDARSKGVALVYQELSLLPNLSVADNIFLGREPGRITIDEQAMHDEAAAVLAQLGVEGLTPDTLVGSLPLAQQQQVEIAKALSLRPRILILDEPTAALTPSDAERLFVILKRLQAQDIAIVYITHRMKEILAHCSSGTILRNGHVVETRTITPATTEEALTEGMIGQHVESFYRRHEGQGAADAEVMLAVEQLSVPNRVQSVSFVLRKGEILGITGLLGAGQNELARTIYGIMPQGSAVIRRNGKQVRISSPEDAIEQGICLLTEHRKAEGLFLEMSVKENITLPSLTRFLYSGVVRLLARRKERLAVDRMVGEIGIGVRSPEVQIRTLSGGNQQKSILARWLLRHLEVLLFIEPTRGIDVGAKAEIYRHLSELAKAGRGIIVVSPELPEVMGISDRILVMYEGRIFAEFAQSEASEEALFSALQGSAPATAPPAAADPVLIAA